MFHSVGRIMGWAKNYRKRMILGFVCSFFATWCTAGPVMLAAWALGRMIGNAWGENELSGSLPWLCLSGIVVLILLRFFFTYWKNRLQESIGTERAAEQRMELGNVLKRVSLGYFAKNDLGDILAALTTELSTLELQSMKMVDAVVNGYIQVAVILLCVAFFLPACRAGGADRCAGVRLCAAGHWPSERPHRSCEPPGSGGIVRRGCRIHPRSAGSEILWTGRGFRSAVPGRLPGQ